MIASTALAKVRASPRILPHLLIISFAMLTYHGALLLGLSMDDYSGLENYGRRTLLEIVTRPAYNRFPPFAFFLYPLMLHMPYWLAHLLVIVAHTFVALQIYRLLVWFGAGERTAVVAGLLFLVWPAHQEALFWLVASTVVFGVAAALAGVVRVAAGRRISGILLIFLGMLFSEAVFFPALFVLGLVALRRRETPLAITKLLGAAVGLYALFQLLRRLISVAQQFTQYPLGLASVWMNLHDLVLMGLGLASSRDSGWLWAFASTPTDVSLDLPRAFILPALVAAVVAAYLVQQLPAGGLVGLRPRAAALICAAAGYGIALLIFLGISGEFVYMQSRYTYTSVAYLCVFVALPVSWALLSPRRPLAMLGQVALVALLSWCVYQAWSNVWANWYPARQLSDRIIEDVRATYDERGVERILLVNEPRAVGSGYSISRDWAFRSVGRMYVSPGLKLDSERFANALGADAYTAGERFSYEPCVFLGWDDGRRVVDVRALDPYNQLVLNCETGLVEAAPPGLELPLIYQYNSWPSNVNLAEVIGPTR